MSFLLGPHLSFPTLPLVSETFCASKGGVGTFGREGGQGFWVRSVEVGLVGGSGFLNVGLPSFVDGFCFSGWNFVFGKIFSGFVLSEAAAGVSERGCFCNFAFSAFCRDAEGVGFVFVVGTCFFCWTLALGKKSPSPAIGGGGGGGGCGITSGRLHDCSFFTG